MFEEDAELRVGLWVDRSLEHWEENVLQHFAKVGNKVPASEDVTVVRERKTNQQIMNLLLMRCCF